MARWGRVITAMATPMGRDGSLDLDRAADLAVRLVETGSDGVVVAGTTGESPTLSDREKIDLFRVVVGAIGGRAAVLAGTGTYDTAHSVHLTKEAERVGVDGVMAVVPYYNKPPQEGLYRHFRTIAGSTALPVLMYNIPARTGQNMTPDTVARLAEIANVAAVKEASGSADQVTEIRARTRPDFLIYSGDDSLTLPFLAAGAAGIVSVAAHLVGRRLQDMIAAWERGETATATAIHVELLPLFKALFVTTNPIPLKAALRLAGFEAGPLRLPLVEASEEQVATVRRAMQALGLVA